MKEEAFRKLKKLDIEIGQIKKEIAEFSSVSGGYIDIVRMGGGLCKEIIHSRNVKTETLANFVNVVINELKVKLSEKEKEFSSL